MHEQGVTVQALEDPLQIASHLSVALRIRIKRLSVGAETDPLTSHLVAWKTGHFILIDNPEADGKSVNLLTGESLGVSFVLEGVAYGFVSELLRWMHEPARMVFIRFPGRVEVKMFRQHKRVLVKLESEIRHTPAAGPEAGKEQTDKGTVTDLSSNGCQLFSNTKFEIGSSLTLAFELPGGALVEGLHGAVRRAASVNERFVYGVELFSTNDEPYQRLLSFVQVFQELGP